MDILYRCDQCSHEEWRSAGQEPWLCVVCGYMRWEAVAESESTDAEDRDETTGPDEDPPPTSGGSRA
jgi:ribosomal protein L37AE/L43A